MREGDQGNVDASHAADLGGEHSRGIDNKLGADLAAIGEHAAHLPIGHLDAGDPGLFADLRAAPSSALDQRKRQLARVDVAVGREVAGANHRLGGHGREHALGLVG